jgi:hypothetical protein
MARGIRGPLDGLHLAYADDLGRMGKVHVVLHLKSYRKVLCFSTALFFNRTFFNRTLRRERHKAAEGTRFGSLQFFGFSAGWKRFAAEPLLSMGKYSTCLLCNVLWGRL